MGMHSTSTIERPAPIPTNELTIPKGIVSDAFKSLAAVHTFALTDSEICHLNSPITLSSLCQEVLKAPRHIIPIDLANDGVICFNANDLDLKANKVWISVPGIKSRICEIILAPESLEIKEIKSFVRPELFRAILLESSSPISVDLLKLLGDNLHIEENLSAFKDIVEVGENEAVIVDSKGDAIIIATKDHLIGEAKVYGMRSGVKVTQSNGLRYCGGLIIHDDHSSILLHGRGPEAFDILLRKSLEFAARIGFSHDKASCTLCISDYGTMSAGSGMMVVEYTRSANELVATSNKLLQIDTESYSFDQGSKQVAPSCRRLQLR